MDILRQLTKIPIGTGAARELCRLNQLFEPGRLYRRVEVSDALRAAFIEHGGSADTSREWVATVLRKWLVGSASPFRKEARGLYLFLGFEDGAVQYEGAPARANAVSDAPLVESLTPEREIGAGPCEVYAWSLPMYESIGGVRWPIKLGCAGEEGFARKLREFQDDLPERPRYLLRFGCADQAQAQRCEMILHAWFASRGQELDGSPGRRWFQTNPREIEQAVHNLSVEDDWGQGRGTRKVRDIFAAAFKDVPSEDWAGIPEDITDRLDEYLYGILDQ